MFGHQDDQSQYHVDETAHADANASIEELAHHEVVQPDHLDQNQPPVDPPPMPNHTGDLVELKQNALSQLAPLVSHLDQSPEEKFRVLMMMIQASDDQSLLQEAYETAQHIADEKTKAQALLDIINEINYFTQHKS